MVERPVATLSLVVSQPLRISLIACALGRMTFERGLQHSRGRIVFGVLLDGLFCSFFNFDVRRVRRSKTTKQTHILEELLELGTVLLVQAVDQRVQAAIDVANPLGDRSQGERYALLELCRAGELETELELGEDYVQR